jgi:ubiquinone/menaquinone biosynthesis C-methylase UbiE
MNEGYENLYFEREYFILHEGKKQYISFLCGLVKRHRVSTILDIGCGYGFFLEGLDKHGSGSYGIDCSRIAIIEAKKRTEANLVLSDSVKLPFQDDKFDAVTLFDVIEHIQEYESVLKEIFRVLKSDGLIYIITLNSSSLLRLLFGRSWSWYVDPTHKHIFSTQQIKSDLEKIGFSEVSARTFFNLNVAGETTKILKFFRKFSMILFVPKFGDSILATGQAKK